MARADKSRNQVSATLLLDYGIDIAPGTIGAMERGEIPVPAERLVVMATLYGVSVAWIMTGEEPTFLAKK